VCDHFTLVEPTKMEYLVASIVPATQTLMTTYREAGVDIDAANLLVQRIKARVRSTFTPNVIGDLGMFGAFYRASFRGLKRPVLVTSVDGVGTKLNIAFAMNRHDTVGQDLVNHCVNDILVCGARPLYFVDYFAMGKLLPDVGEQVLTGFVQACKENGCALIGGETAEMPGLYAEGEYDLAGTIVGVVDQTKILNGRKVKRGDVLIGLPSTGLHTNGYSLARHVLLKRFSLSDRIDGLKGTLGETLLTVHRSYYRSIYPLISAGRVNALSHVTGGGIVENTMRVVPKGLALNIDWHAWERPAIFTLIQRTGDVPEDDLRRTLNLGIGMVLIVPCGGADRVMRSLQRRGERPVVIGEVVKQ
jgi:phosphoribosylformylglycinamidine cyclo-ligase